MKNFTLIAWALITTFTLVAFTYSSWTSPTANKVSCQAANEIEPPTFFYSLSAGCNNTISKERIHNAKTIADLMPDHGMQENLNNNILSLRDVDIKVEQGNAHCTSRISEKGNNNLLNKAQLNLLQSTDYSTNFFLEGYATDINSVNDLNNDRYFNYCMTVVPEQQASYNAGNSAFVDFLKSNCQSTIAKLQRGNLKSGNISFTVSKAGIVSNIALNSSCGYPDIDKRMMDLVQNLPDDWNAATNGQGEKLNQTFVFSYGQLGC